MARILTLLAIALAGCSVPTIDFLEPPRSCDASHPCFEGVCSRGLCVPEASVLTDAGVALPDSGVPECAATATRPCGSSAGECKPGTQGCVDGHWEACTGSVGPTDEICDGKDNNCDGATDEEVNLRHSPCVLQKGICAGSHKRCVSGSEPACSAADYGADFESGPETRCDGLDNNCDGETDEGLDNDHDGFGVEAKCPLGSGDCDDWDPAIHPGALEVCNGLDDDCDGTADNQTAGFKCIAGARTAACDSGCNSTGREVCNAKCDGTICEPPLEVCNGRDDNCDGKIDEQLTGATVRVASARTAPFVAGLSGGGFSVLTGADPVAIQRLNEPDDSTGPLVAIGAPAKAVPLAITRSHVLWRQDDGVFAKVLHQGMPVGSAFQILAASTGTVLTSAGAIDSPTAGRSLFAVGRDAKNVMLVGLDGVKAGVPIGVTAANLTSVALARLPDDRPVVAWANTAGELKASVQTNEIAGAAFDLASSTLIKPRSPAGAGAAFAFIAEDSGGTAKVFLAHAQDTTVPAGKDLLAVSTDTTVDAPALAAIAPDSYLVAWLTKSTTTYVKTVRVTYDPASGWGKPSSSTGFQHPDGKSPVVATQIGSDQTRFVVLFQTLSTTTGDEIFSRLDCPAN